MSVNSLSDLQEEPVLARISWCYYTLVGEICTRRGNSMQRVSAF